MALPGHTGACHHLDEQRKAHALMQDIPHVGLTCGQLDQSLVAGVSDSDNSLSSISSRTPINLHGTGITAHP